MQSYFRNDICILLLQSYKYSIRDNSYFSTTNLYILKWLLAAHLSGTVNLCPKQLNGLTLCQSTWTLSLCRWMVSIIIYQLLWLFWCWNAHIKDVSSELNENYRWANSSAHPSLPTHRMATTDYPVYNTVIQVPIGTTKYSTSSSDWGNHC